MDGTSVIVIVGFISNETSQLFDEDTVELLGRFSESAALAILDAQEYTGSQNSLAQSQRDNQALKDQACLERLVARMATHFINLPSDEIDQGIEQAQQAISRITHIDRIYLFYFSAEFAVSGVAHEWRPESIPPIPDELITLYDDGFDWGIQQLNQLRTIHVTRAEDLPLEASDLASYLSANGIKSFTAFPLAFKSSVLGFLGFDSIHQEKSWSVEAI